MASAKPNPTQETAKVCPRTRNPASAEISVSYYSSRPVLLCALFAVADLRFAACSGSRHVIREKMSSRSLVFARFHYDIPKYLTFFQLLYPID